MPYTTGFVDKQQVRRIEARHPLGVGATLDHDVLETLKRLAVTKAESKWLALKTRYRRSEKRGAGIPQGKISLPNQATLHNLHIHSGTAIYRI